MDCIRLTGIRAYGYIGVLPEEHTLGQWFEVNLTLWLDLTAAGQSDRLEDTLDYRAVISTVQTLIKTSQFALLERLTSAIADAVLALNHPSSGPAIEQVQVCLTKLTPPIADFSGSITIEMTRSRPSQP